jgi:hypothetical protein
MASFAVPQTRYATERRAVTSTRYSDPPFTSNSAVKRSIRSPLQNETPLIHFASLNTVFTALISLAAIPAAREKWGKR